MFWETVYGNCIFPKKCRVVTLTDMIIYDKCIIFVIAHGEMHTKFSCKNKGNQPIPSLGPSLRISKPRNLRNKPINNKTYRKVYHHICLQNRIGSPKTNQMH